MIVQSICPPSFLHARDEPKFQIPCAARRRARLQSISASGIALDINSQGFARRGCRPVAEDSKATSRCRV